MSEIGYKISTLLIKTKLILMKEYEDCCKLISIILIGNSFKEFSFLMMHRRTLKT